MQDPNKDSYEDAVTFSDKLRYAEKRLLEYAEGLDGKPKDLSSDLGREKRRADRRGGKLRKARESDFEEAEDELKKQEKKKHKEGAGKKKKARRKQKDHLPSDFEIDAMPYQQAADTLAFIAQVADKLEVEFGPQSLNFAKDTDEALTFEDMARLKKLIHFEKDIQALGHLETRLARMGMNNEEFTEFQWQYNKLINTVIDGLKLPEKHRHPSIAAQVSELPPKDSETPMPSEFVGDITVKAAQEGPQIPLQFPEKHAFMHNLALSNLIHPSQIEIPWPEEMTERLKQAHQYQSFDAIQPALREALADLYNKQDLSRDSITAKDRPKIFDALQEQISNAYDGHEAEQVMNNMVDLMVESVDATPERVRQRQNRIQRN